MPMQRRLPKRGFKNPFRIESHPVNLDAIAAKFEDGAVVDIEALRGAGLIPKKANVIKILGNGNADKKLTVCAHRFSKSAIAKLEALGGKAEIVPIRRGGAAADDTGSAESANE